MNSPLHQFMKTERRLGDQDIDELAGIQPTAGGEGALPMGAALVLAGASGHYAGTVAGAGGFAGAPFETTQTESPASRADTAARNPAAPLPITMISKETCSILPKPDEPESRVIKKDYIRQDLQDKQDRLMTPIRQKS